MDEVDTLAHTAKCGWAKFNNVQPNNKCTDLILLIQVIGFVILERIEKTHLTTLHSGVARTLG